jgi:hypothetical protein
LVASPFRTTSTRAGDLAENPPWTVTVSMLVDSSSVAARQPRVGVVDLDAGEVDVERRAEPAPPPDRPAVGRAAERDVGRPDGGATQEDAEGRAAGGGIGCLRLLHGRERRDSGAGGEERDEATMSEEAAIHRLRIPTKE